MRLIVHAGLHKTASTYFQDILRLNHETLAHNGVYTLSTSSVPDYHSSAWTALTGEFADVVAHIEAARQRGLGTVLLSSEDFEALVFYPARAAALETAARNAGVTEVEWHFCLRDPGEYLLSMYAQLAGMEPVNFSSMFLSALRDGRYRMARGPDKQPRVWEFCFDPGTFVPIFAAGISGRVALHDFRDQTPFPGHGLLERLMRIAEAIMPGESSRNSRLTNLEIRGRLGRRVRQIVAGSGLKDDEVKLLARSLFVPAATREACATALSRKYAPGMVRLLAEGPYASRQP